MVYDLVARPGNEHCVFISQANFQGACNPSPPPRTNHIAQQFLYECDKHAVEQ